MRRYKLSQHIQVKGWENLQNEEVPQQYRTGYFLLCDTMRSREFLINETIKYFIDKFSSPKSRAEIIAEVAEDVKSDQKQVEKTCTAFMRYLRKKRFLLPEKATEIKTGSKPLYKKGEAVNKYLINRVLVNKREIDIYTVIDQTNDQQCVIKLLNRNKLADERKYTKEVKYLQREFDLLQKAGDVPAISKAYSLEQDKQGNVFIVLEWIEGTAIAHFVKQKKNATRKNSLFLIRNMLEAFTQLHISGTVHGDVHSANVLVTENKDVRIIDLGLSINKTLEENQVLKHGGVDYYMPPERINASSVKKYTKPPDFFSDVYQIGLLMYVVLYHCLPFKGFIWEELAAAIKEGDAAFPDRAANGFVIPQDLKKIIAKCLAKEPENRYASAAAILNEFVAHAFKKRVSK